jgi:signal transduction histidine kinase
MNLKATGLFLFTFLMLSEGQLNGQKLKVIDSLKQQLKKEQADTLLALTLLNISINYQAFQPDSAMTYANASLKKSLTLKYKRGHADALLQIARLKREQGNSAEALTGMFSALALYREINDRVQIAHSLNDISIIYANDEDYQKSLEYFKQALDIFKQMKDEKGESYALNNIGIIYQELGDEVKAKEYFILSLNIKKKHNDLYGIARGYTNLGTIAEDNKHWDEALNYYLRADSLYEVTSDVQAQSSNFVDVARVKDKQGKSKEAKRYASIALAKGKEVNALSHMLTATKLLASLEEKENHYKESLAYQKLYNQIADSLNNKNHRANLEELKTKFNFEEKEREIVLLKKDKELQRAAVERKTILTYSLTAGIFLLLVVLGLMYFAYRTVKSKKESLALKNKEIEQQRNDLDKLNREKDRFFSILSHDLRSPLNSLKGFSYLITQHVHAMTREELMDMRARIDLSLDNLTELINNILEWSMASSHTKKWTFDKINTTELIAKNISLYQTTAENKKISLRYLSEEELYGYGDYQAIDTVVRNLLSNSIKFSHPETDVIITTKRVQDSVRISVKDKGVGISPDILKKLFSLNENVTQPGTNNEKGTGLGLTLCKELIKENMGDISVISKPGEGSEFIVVIPEYNSYTRMGIAIPQE